MNQLMLSLNNGTSVSLEEFNSWSPQRQWRRTIPIEQFNAIYKDKQAPISKAVNTPKGQFPSIRDAAKAFNISAPTLRGYLHNEAYPEFNFVDPKNLIKKAIKNKVLNAGKKNTFTPKGIFPSKIEAAKAYGLTKGQFERLMQREPMNYYYTDDNINKRTRIAKA